MTELHIRRDQAERCLHLSGEIDLETSQELREALADALSSWQSADIDMAGVTFMDSSGIHALFEAASSLQGDDAIWLRDVPGNVEVLFDIVGADDVSRLKRREQP
jgi:anti-anti-sigma factor